MIQKSAGYSDGVVLYRKRLVFVYTKDEIITVVVRGLKYCIMEVTLIFDSKLSGHHLEYLGHLWKICENKPNRCFIFLVPDSFGEKRNLLGLQDRPNISISFLTEGEYKKCNFGGKYSKAWHTSKILARHIKRNSVSKVFLISVVDCLPFLPFFISSKTKVSGIIYGIYLYKWKESPVLRRISDVLKYSLYARLPVFQSLFILNDSESARRINYLYRTSKFSYLPDPYLPIIPDKGRSIREEYGIDSQSLLFVHFGSLGIRKGTMVILESIEQLSDLNNDYAFIIAGRVSDSIKEPFYSLLSRVKSKNESIKVIIEDTFCDYPYLGKLCEECDAILVPYLDTTRSSGILGYASQFHKPVIAPSSGLIGRLVKKYKLGYLLPSVNPTCLCNAYRSFNTRGFDKLNSEYVLSHDVHCFMEIIGSKL